MANKYENLSDLVSELRCCFDQHKETPSITDKIQAVLKPWVENPHWIKPEYQHCKTEEDIYPLYQADKNDIMISIYCWRQGDVGCIHDHNTWAVIGVAQGGETHTLWERTDDRSVEGYATITKDQTITIGPGEVMTLPEDGVHCVVNDSAEKSTIAIHVYGGDYAQLNRLQYFPDENRTEVLVEMK